MMQFFHKNINLLGQFIRTFDSLNPYRFYYSTIHFSRIAKQFRLNTDGHTTVGELRWYTTNYDNIGCVIYG